MIKISEAECEVLRIIWENDEITSLEVIDKLNNSNWKNNTTRTLIRRLLDKGAIKVVKKEGKSYRYTAIINKNEYRKTITKNLISKFYNNSAEELILNCCEIYKITPEEIKKLAKKIH